MVKITRKRTRKDKHSKRKVSRRRYSKSRVSRKKNPKRKVSKRRYTKRMKGGMEALSLPPGWEKAKNPEGRTYYLDHNTGTTHWDPPKTEPAPVSEPTPVSETTTLPEPVPAPNPSEKEIMAWRPVPTGIIGKDPGLYRFIFKPNPERNSSQDMEKYTTRYSECMTVIIIGMNYNEIDSRLNDINRLVEWTSENTGAPSNNGLCLILVSDDGGIEPSIHDRVSISIKGGTKIIQLTEIKSGEFHIQTILREAEKLYKSENKGREVFKNFPKKIDIAISDVSSPAINISFPCTVIPFLEYNSNIFIRQPLNVSKINSYRELNGSPIFIGLTGGQYYQDNLSRFSELFSPEKNLRFGVVVYKSEEEIRPEHLPLLRNGETEWK